MPNRNSSPRRRDAGSGLSLVLAKFKQREAGGWLGRLQWARSACLLSS